MNRKRRFPSRTGATSARPPVGRLLPLAALAFLLASTLLAANAHGATFTQTRVIPLGVSGRYNDWGVLAINFNKSVYKPGEKVDISLAALDKLGLMDCGAVIGVEITAPSKKKTVLSTRDKSITRNQECFFHGKTERPDYAAKFTPTEIGRHDVVVTAKSDSGMRRILDKFHVERTPEFDVERSGPTRIYPVEPYVMKIAVRPAADYDGHYSEIVPQALWVKSHSPGAVITTDGANVVITWPMKAKAGKKVEFWYEFDAADISPGEFVIRSAFDGRQVERRGWRLASDATATNYPGTAAVSNATAPWDDLTWINPGSINANDGTGANTTNTAYITDAAFDTNVYSYVLSATNFGFNLTAGSTINGITVSIERGDSAGSAVDDLIQLIKGGARTGDNKSAAALYANNSMGVDTFGGAADMWGTTWTEAEVEAANFGVAIAAKATANNTDIYIDYVTITITYTLPPPNATSYTNDTEGALNNLGARVGQTVTITGTDFGAACNNTDPETAIWIGGVDTGYEVLCANVSAWSATSITFTVNAAINQYGGTGSNGITIENQGSVDSSPLDFYVYPDITSLTTPLVADAAREYDAGDADGVITLNGSRFGTAGTVTILGQTATQNSYADTAIEVRVPAAIADSTYTGSIVVTRTTPADNRTDTFSTFRVLPRIASLSPTSGCVGSSVTISGDHFCQNGGTCPTAPTWSSASHNVTFNGTQAADGDFTSWSDTSIVVNVPTGATTGNVRVRSNTSYDSNNMTFTVDSNPPTQAGHSPANGASTTTSPTVTFTLNKNGDCRWSLNDETYDAMSDDGDCTGDGGTSMSCAVSGLVGPADDVYFACEDTCANKDTAGTNTGLTYNIDTVAPTQSAHSPANAAETTSSPTVTFTLNENGDCKWSLTDDAYSAMTNDCTGDGTTSITCVTSGLVSGAEQVFFACQDTATNADTAGTNTVINYTVDSTYPVLSNISPAAGSTITSTSQAVTFDLDEAGDCKWSLSDDTYAAMSNACANNTATNKTCNVTGMVEGAEVVYVACQDTTPGNQDTAATNEHISYTIDTTPPTQSGHSPADSAAVCSTSQTVTFTLNENGNCKWSLTDQTYAAMAGDCTGDGTTSMSCAVTGMVAGAEIVYFACSDTAGNANSAANNTEINYTVTTDTTPPTQSAHSPAPASTITSSETLTFTLSAAGDCRWSLSDQAYSAMGNDCSGDGTTSMTCILAGLSEGAEVVYTACRKTACSEDTAGSNTALNYTVSNPPAPPMSGVNAFYNSADPFAQGAATDIITSFSTSTTKFDTQIEILSSTTSAYVRRFYSDLPGSPPAGYTFTQRWEGTTGAMKDNSDGMLPGTYVGKAKSGLTWTYNTKIEGSGIVMARPTDIYVDGNNNIYTVNKDTAVVEKVNTSHTLLLKFTAAATTPQGVAADSNGNIYVSDYGGSRIMKYDSTGALVNANYITGLTTPRGIYVYSTFIYIAHEANLISKYNLSTGAVTWSVATDDDPIDVAVGTYGGAVRVFVTIGPDDEINTFNDTDGSDYTTNQSALNCDQPYGIDVDSRTAVTALYITCTNTGGHYVKRYNLADGLAASETASYSFGNGTAGGSTSQVNTAYGVGKTSSSLYVGDTENNRILALTDSGSLTYSSTVEPDDYNLFVPTDMAIDDDGNIYIGSEEGNFVKKFTKDGEYVATFGQPGTGSGQFDNVTGVEVYDADGDGEADRLFVSDFNNDRIQCLDIDTNLWNSAGACGGNWGASGIAIGEPRGMGFDKANNYVLVSFNAGGGDKGIRRLTVTGTVVDTESSAAIIDDCAADFRGATSHTTSASEQVRTQEAGNVNADCGGSKMPPYGITTDNFGNIYTTSTNDSTCGKMNKYGYYYTTPTTTASMDLVSAYGTYGTADGELKAPRGLAVDPNGTFIWVADRDNNRAQKFLLSYDSTSYDNITICASGPPVVNNVLLSDPSPTQAGTVQFSVAFSACDLQQGYFPRSWFVTADSVSVQIYDESVIRDNGTVSGEYDSGDTVLIGRTPPLGTALVSFNTSEKHVDFASGTVNVYDGGAIAEAICDDADADNVCDTGELLYGKSSHAGLALVAFAANEKHPDWDADDEYDGYFVNNEWKGFGVVPSGHDGVATIIVCGPSPTYTGPKTSGGDQMTACDNTWTFEIDATPPSCTTNIDDLITTETWTPVYGEAETSCDVAVTMTDFACFAVDSDADGTVDAGEGIPGCVLGTNPCCALGSSVMGMTSREKHTEKTGGANGAYDATEAVIYDHPTSGNVGFYDPTFDTIILCNGDTSCAEPTDMGACTAPCTAPSSGDALTAFTSTEKVKKVSYQDVTTSAASNTYYANNISLPVPVPGYKYFSCQAMDDAENQGNWYQPRVRVRRLASLPGRAEFRPTDYDADETLLANNTWTVRYTSSGNFDAGTCDCASQNCYVTIDVPTSWTAPTNVSGAPGEVYISAGTGATVCGTPYSVSGQKVKVYLDSMTDGAYFDMVYGHRGNGGTGATIGSSASVGTIPFTVNACNDCGGSPSSLDNPSLTVHPQPIRISHTEFLGAGNKEVIYDEETDLKVMTINFKNPNVAPNTASVANMTLRVVAAGTNAPYNPDDIISKVTLKDGASNVIVEDVSIETTGDTVSLEGLSGSPITVNAGAETGIEVFIDFKCLSASCTVPSGLTSLYFLLDGNYDIETRTSTAITETTLTDSTKSWATNQWSGYTLIPDVSNPTKNYVVSYNTATTLTVQTTNTMVTDGATSGDTYALGDAGPGYNFTITVNGVSMKAASNRANNDTFYPDYPTATADMQSGTVTQFRPPPIARGVYVSYDNTTWPYLANQKVSRGQTSTEPFKLTLRMIDSLISDCVTNCSSVDVADGTAFAVGESVIVGDADSISTDANSYDQRQINNIIGNTLELDLATANGPYAATNTAHVVRTNAHASIVGMDVTVNGDGESLPDPAPSGLISRKVLESNGVTIADTSDIEGTGTEVSFDTYLDATTGNPINMDTGDFPIVLDFRVDILCSGTPSYPTACPTGTTEKKIRFSIPTAADFTAASATTQIYPSPWVSVTSATATIQQQAWVYAETVDRTSPDNCPGEVGIGETFTIDAVMANAAAEAPFTRASARLYSSANDLKFTCTSGGCTPGSDYTSEFTVTPVTPAAGSYITIQAGATGTMQYNVVQTAASPTPGVFEIDVKYAASVSTSKPESRDLNDFYDSDKLYVNRETDGAATTSCGLDMKAALAYITAKAVSPGTYQAGATNVPIMKFTVTDGVDAPAGWWVREVVIGSANTNDTDVTNVMLWSDRDDDGNFEPTGDDGPAIATTTFTSGYATFTGWADSLTVNRASSTQNFFVSYNLNTTVTDGNTIDAYIKANGVELYDATYATGTHYGPGSNANSPGTSSIDVIATQIIMLPNFSNACIGGEKTIYAYARDDDNNLDTGSTEYVTITMTELNANSTARLATSTALASYEFLPAGGPYTQVRGNLVAGVGDVTFIETESDTITVTPSSSLIGAVSATTVGGNVCLSSKTVTNTSYGAGSAGATILKFTLTNGLAENITFNTAVVNNTGTTADSSISSVKLYKTSIAPGNLLDTDTFTGGALTFNPGVTLLPNEMIDYFVTFDLAGAGVTDNATLNAHIPTNGLLYSTATSRTLDIVNTDSTGNSWVDIDGNTIRLLPAISKVLLTADMAAGTNTAYVTTTDYLLGETQATVGDDYTSEIMSILSVLSATAVRFSTNTANAHTVAGSGYVSNVITNMKDLRIRVEDSYGNVATQDSEGNLEIYSVGCPNPSYIDATTFKLPTDCSSGSFTAGGTAASGCLTSGYATNTIGYSGCAPQSFIVTPNSTLAKYNGREYTATIDFPGDISLDTSGPEDVDISFDASIAEGDCINTVYPFIDSVSGTDDCSGVEKMRFACAGSVAAFANADWVDIGAATMSLDVCCNCPGDSKAVGCGFNISDGSTCEGGFLSDGTCGDADGWLPNASSGCIPGGPNRVYLQLMDKSGNVSTLPTATSTVGVITDVVSPSVSSFYFSTDADAYFFGSADYAACSNARFGGGNIDGNPATLPDETNGNIADECPLWYSNIVAATQTLTAQVTYTELGSTGTFRGSAAFGHLVQTMSAATGTNQTVSLTFNVDSTDGTAATTPITFEFLDACGNSATETFTFGRDVTAPDTPAFTGYATAGLPTSLTNGNWYNYANPSFVWATGSDLPAGTDYVDHSTSRDYLYLFSTDSAAAPIYATTTNAYTSTDTLVSGYSYYLRFQAFDNVNNAQTATSAFIYRYDSTPPNNPAISAYASDSMATAIASGTWYNHANPHFSWAGATDLPAGPLTNSGFRQFNIYWGTDSAGAPTFATTATSLTSTSTLVSGWTYYLRMNSEDNASNATGTTTVFSYYYDSTPPDNPAVSSYSDATMVTSLASGTWYGYTGPHFSWAGATDLPAGPLTNSGFRQFNIYWGTDSAGAPTFATTATSLTSTSTLVAGWTYYLRMNSDDNAGNATGTTTVVSYKYDPNAPDNPTLLKACKQSTCGASDFISGNWYKYPQPYFQWSVPSDNPVAPTNSGLAYYYVYFGTDPTTTPTATQTTATYTAGVPTGAAESGRSYYLIVMTRDNAGNLSATTALFLYRYDVKAPNLPPPNFKAYDTNAMGAELTISTWYNYPAPYFDWDDADDDCGVGCSGTVGYFIQFSTDSNFDPATTPAYFSATSAYDIAASGPTLVANETYYLRARAIDDEESEGNLSLPQSLFIYKYDPNPPQFDYNSPATGTFDSNWYSSDPGAIFDVDFLYASGSPITQYDHRIAAAAWSGIWTGASSTSYLTNWGMTWASLADGINQISLRGSDQAGNWATDSFATNTAGFILRKDVSDPDNPASVNGYASDSLATAIVSGGSYYHQYPYFTWAAPADNPTPVGNNSGVAGYYVGFSTDSNYDPTAFQTGLTYSATPSACNAFHYLRVKTIDNATPTANATGAATLFSYRKLTQPIITDNQTGDDNWHNASGTLYNVDFSGDCGINLNYVELALWSASGMTSGTGSEILTWTTNIGPGIATYTYTADWALNNAAWAAATDGINWVSLRVYDGDGFAGQATDVFYVYKDTQAPNAPTVTGYASASMLTTLTSGNWYRNANPYFTWSAPVDNPVAPALSSGSSSWGIYFGQDPAGTPTFATTALSYEASQTLATGVFYMRMTMTDNAGNSTGPVTTFIYKYDPNPPEILTVNISDTSDYLWVSPITGKLYYGLGMGAAQSFTISGTAMEADSALSTGTFTTAFGDSPATDTTPLVWSATYDIANTDVGGATITITVYDLAGNSGATEVYVVQDNRLFIEYSTMTPPWLPTFTKFRLYYPDYAEIGTYGTATMMITDGSTGLYSTQSGGVDVSDFFHAYNNVGTERTVYDDVNDVTANSFIINSLSYQTGAADTCGSVGGQYYWCLELYTTNCVSGDNPHYIGASGTFTADGFFTYLPIEDSIDGDMGAAETPPLNPGDLGTFDARPGPDYMVVKPENDGLILAETVLTSWCAGGGCSPACTGAYCSNQAASITAKPDFVKYNYVAYSNIADNTAPAASQWSYDSVNGRVMLFNDPSGATVSYTPNGGAEQVCVYLYDGCDVIIDSGKWHDVPVRLILSDAPDSGKDITRSDVSAGNWGFAAVTDPASNDFTPADQLTIKGKLEKGKACVTLTAEWAPSDDPQTPIKISPTYFNEDTGATTTLWQSGGTDTPALVLITPSAGVASGTTSVRGFASEATIFIPDYTTAATQALVFNPTWGKTGGKLAFISLQGSPCGGSAAAGDTPYDNFNIYSSEYDAVGATWTHCVRYTKNATDGVDDYGVAAWSDITWNPTDSKFVFAAIDLMSSGIEKLFWVNATSSVGSATGPQYNMAPSEPAQTYYSLNADANAGATTLDLADVPPYVFATGSWLNVSDWVTNEVVKVTAVSGQTVTFNPALSNTYTTGSPVITPASLQDTSQMITSATDTQLWFDPDWSPDDATCDAAGAVAFRNKLMAVRRPSLAGDDLAGAPPYTSGGNVSANAVYFSGTTDANGVYRQGMSTINRITSFTGDDVWPMKPKWSPDCSKIAFVAWDRDPDANPTPPSKSSIYMINLTDTSMGATATLPISSLTATGVYQVYDYNTNSEPAFFPNWSADGKIVLYAVDINNALDLEQINQSYDALVDQIFGAADFDNYMEYIMDQSVEQGAVKAPQIIGRAGYNEFGMTQCPGTLTGATCPEEPNYPFTYVAQTSANIGALRVFSMQDESYITDNGGLLFQNGIVTAVFPPGVVASDTVFYNTWPTPYCTPASSPSETDGGGGAGTLGGNCAEDPTNSDFIVSSGEAREYFPDGSNFKSYVRLIFHYCDNDDDGYVDLQTESRGFTYNTLTGMCQVGGVNTSGGRVDVNSLSVYYWDAAQGKWIRLTGVVNTADKTISVFSSHFSRYETLGLRSGFQAAAINPLRMDNIHTYPNPWQTSMRGSGMNIRFNATRIDGDCPVNVTAHIYDIRGKLVRTLTSMLTDPPGFATEEDLYFAGEGYTFLEWDGRNDSGRDVASGVYLYYMHAADTCGFSVTHKGKVAVIH